MKGTAPTHPPLKKGLVLSQKIKLLHYSSLRVWVLKSYMKMQTIVKRLYHHPLVNYKLLVISILAYSFLVLTE